MTQSKEARASHEDVGGRASKAWGVLKAIVYCLLMVVFVGFFGGVVWVGQQMPDPNGPLAFLVQLAMAVGGTFLFGAGALMLERLGLVGSASQPGRPLDTPGGHGGGGDVGG